VAASLFFPFFKTTRRARGRTRMTKQKNGLSSHGLPLPPGFFRKCPASESVDPAAWCRTTTPACMKNTPNLAGFFG